jgi:hypothetical protein
MKGTTAIVLVAVLVVIALVEARCPDAIRPLTLRKNRLRRQIEELSDSLSNPQAVLAAKLAFNAYETTPFGGAANGEWQQVLATNINNRWAVTKVYTNNVDTVMVAYKGTDSDANMATNFVSAIPEPCIMNGKTCGKVGFGFLKQFQADIDQVQAAVAPFIQKGYQLILTGHSLGGATATLAAFHFATAFPAALKPTLIVFASPRVGDKKWVAAFNAEMQEASVTRYTTFFKKPLSGVTLVDWVTLMPFYFNPVGTEVKVQCPVADDLECHRLVAYMDGVSKQ